MYQIAFFYIPMPNKESAKNMAITLLEKRLIACANIVEGESLHNFENKLNHTTETLLLAKTAIENINPVIEFIESIHPYEIPLIAHYAINANQKYYEWLKKQLLT